MCHKNDICDNQTEGALNSTYPDNISVGAKWKLRNGKRDGTWEK